MSIAISPDILKIARAIKQAQTVSKILEKGEMSADDVRKLLKTVGLSDDAISGIMEAKKKYEETEDPEPVIEAVAKAFGMPVDELKKWIGMVDIVSTMLQLA